MEACDFVRNCFAKISRKKFSGNLKRVTVKNPYRRTSALESLFNEIAGINSRLASLVKKSQLELSALLRKGLIRVQFFFIKMRAVHYMVATLLRSWPTIDFFVKIFFKAASFRYILQKVSAMSYLNSKVAV